VGSKAARRRNGPGLALSRLLAQPLGTDTTRAPRILVVDDEPPLVELVRGYLAREGFEIITAGDGPGAVRLVRDEAPDVLVLDVGLPGFDGLEVRRQIRVFSDAYVLMLTARGEEIDRVVGLTVGADDYLVKPFSPRELVARVKALLRRSRTAGPRSLPLPAGLEFDAGCREVLIDGSTVTLTTTEFDLLATLVSDPGVVVPRSHLLERIWGTEFAADDHLVDVHIGNLRRKLGDDPVAPRFVETIRGVGYRLRTP
jgi:DNA-binding response OmpR family regulator